MQHLDFLTEQEKAVYKTAFELDQRWMIEHAADRAPFICQSQSVNVFLPANVHKRDLHQIHFMAWKRGVKSLYYCRSLSIQRADNVSEKAVAPAAFIGVMGVPANDGQAPLPLVAGRRCGRMRRITRSVWPVSKTTSFDVSCCSGRSQMALFSKELRPEDVFTPRAATVNQVHRSATT